MKNVTIYTKNDCPQCTVTKSVLKRKGITYTEHNVEEEPLALEFVKNLGYLSAPVVVVGFEHETMGGQHWSGVQRDLLNAL